MEFSEADPATWGHAPTGYRFLTIDHETGELHMFAPDGRNVSDPNGPKISELVPDAVVRAAIVATIRDHAYEPRWDGSEWYQYHDMVPVVHRAESLGEVNEWGDSWVVEVQYSSRGGRAVYGVNRNHVPSCYMD